MVVLAEIHQDPDETDAEEELVVQGLSLLGSGLSLEQRSYCRANLVDLEDVRFPC